MRRRWMVAGRSFGEAASAEAAIHFTSSVRAVVVASQCFTQAGAGPWSIAAMLVLLTLRDVAVKFEPCRCQL